MFQTETFRRLSSFVSRNYESNVRKRAEYAMDTLLGTMIGVLFLAVISASFAGVYMAYVVSSSKAEENSARSSLLAKETAQALKNMFVDSISGQERAEAWGWEVVTQGTNTLSAVNSATNSAYADYTYAAQKPMVSGGELKMSQWGVLVKSGPETGLVKVYTSVPKAGLRHTCDWTTSVEDLSRNCVTVYNTAPSIVSPPVAYTIYPSVEWENYITAANWTTSPNYYTADKRAVTTSKLGTVDVSGLTANPDGTRTVRFVAMLEDLTAGDKVAIDFHQPGASSFYGHVLTPTANSGETGKLKRAVNATVTIPAGVNTVDIYLDTKVTNPDLTTDPTVKLSRFVVYQTTPPVEG